MSDTQGVPPVVDHRPVPRGVLPRGIQTWLMVALALGMVLIIIFTGQPQAPATTANAPVAQQAINADRVREYQERLKALNGQMATQLRPAAAEPPTLPPSLRDNPVTAAPRTDPVDAERRRRDYDSLFASNVVATRRQSLQNTDRPSTVRSNGDQSGLVGHVEPSLDDIADAVGRASARSATAGRNTPSEEVRGRPINDNVPSPSR